MRRQLPCDVSLRERWGRAQDQFGTTNGFCDISGDQRKLCVVPTVCVLHGNARTLRAMLSRQVGVATPKPHLMALQREIAGGRKRAVAAAKDCDFQIASPCANFTASSCF